MAKKKSKAELEAENERLRKSRLADIIVPIATLSIKCGTLLGVVYFGYLMVSVIAGKNTNADINVGLFSNLFNLKFLIQSKISIFAGIGGTILGACGIIYGQRQRNLRMTTIERLQERNVSKEKSFDPYRSSSMLTTKGETRPEDH